MRRAAMAFADALLKLIRRRRVLVSAPPGEGGTGQAMPKAHKSSETSRSRGVGVKGGSSAPASAKAPAKKVIGNKAAASTAGAKTAPAKAAPAKAAPAKTTSARSAKSAASSKPAPRAVAKKAPVARAAVRTKKVGSPPAKKPGGVKAPPAKAAEGRRAAVRKPAEGRQAAVRKPADHKPAAPRRDPVDDQHRKAFLAEQRVLLIEERAGYVRQADELKAEADSLALEHEPGDVQFDEEGGEGGTSNVDRELDLVLSAQARAAILEIDRSLAKIEHGNYRTCEQCGQPIPQARLKALPYAALCVACKSGGLSRR
jgi:RNA polymerase-binding transcription factor DksA